MKELVVGVRFCVLSIVLSVVFIVSHAQNFSYTSTKVGIQKAARVNLKLHDDVWMPTLESIEKPKPGGESGNIELQLIKKVLSERYSKKVRYKKESKKSSNSFGTAPDPIVQKNFQGNIASGTPLDNDVAISNDGIMVSVVNTNIYIYDTNNNDTLILKPSLEVFATASDSVPKNPTNGYINNKFDPKVIYDSEADRFIIVMLNGYDPTYSKIIVAFSQSNDPTEDWNIYVVPGNPLNNNRWTDYPQIALTQEDFFITINLLADTNLPGQKPWELAFKDDIIWQIDKNDGYNGMPTLSSTIYHDLKYDGKHLQYICPIKSGDEHLEPNMYLVSNKPFTQGNDTLFLIEVRGSLSSGNASVDFVVGTLDVEYYVPPDVQQLYSGDSLFTNDARILGGFYQNDQIQFVFPTLDTSTGLSAIYHGIIKNISDTSFEAVGRIIGNDTLEFGFPNISYTGLTGSENESIISFDHSSTYAFPGISAIFYNNDGGYSNIILVKEGDTIINNASAGATKARWGDYTGSQRKYNDPHTVWVSGTFGTKGTTGNQRKGGTWVAELTSPTTTTQIPSTTKLNVFPNPLIDMFSVNFNLASDSPITIKIRDVKGCIVHQWEESNAKAGQNIFSFSTLPLSKGVYVISIEANNKIIESSKIVKN